MQDQPERQEEEQRKREKKGKIAGGGSAGSRKPPPKKRKSTWRRISRRSRRKNNPGKKEGNTARGRISKRSRRKSNPKEEKGGEEGTEREQDLTGRLNTKLSVRSLWHLAMFQSVISDHGLVKAGLLCQGSRANSPSTRRQEATWGDTMRVFLMKFKFAEHMSTPCFI